MAREAYDLGKDARDWKVDLAQKDLKESALDKEKIQAILYKPFDTRYTYYTGKSRGFHCRTRAVFQHLPEKICRIFKDRLSQKPIYERL